MPRKVPVWERFADAVLMREAALTRLVSGVPPRETAGMYVTDADLDALLRTLPGLDGPQGPAVEAIQQILDPLVDMAKARLPEWVRTGSDPLAGVVRRSFAAPEDAEVLAVLTAVELDPQRQRLVGYVQDDVRLPRLHQASLRRMFGSDHRGVRAVAESSPLGRAGVVQVEDTGPWATRMCSVSSSVIWAELGVAGQDPALPAGVTRRPAVLSDPEPLAAEPGSVVLVHGADPESRKSAAARLFPSRPLICTPPARDDAGWQALVRESVVTGAVVVIELPAPLDPLAARWLTRADQVSWVICSPGELPMEGLPDRPWREVCVLDGTAGDDDWFDSFGAPAPAGVRLSREQLRLVAAASGGDHDRVHHGVRRLAGGHLDHLAVRVRPRRGWQDLVLPEHQIGQLRQLAVRHRQKSTVFGRWGFPAIPSSGVVALFAGPSGTGKTLAAEVIAADLGLDLYKVDLSAVVSKYIGETEKNLERIFTAAAAGDLVLFFDEADALFGKRSEVSSSHDRYANIEVAYLLQRLETYDGLVVLATNLQRNIDDAFLRRIGIAVSFPPPDEEQRRRIWSLVFPRQAPVCDLDVHFLARQFEVPGGIIRSAALGAAFAAAENDSLITMDLVAKAMKREFAKLGRLSTETEFDRYFEVVRGAG